ncbi:MAG: cardiolipin synthase [Planctomycetes bacterium]|nr:cardiolipin synthase [Planctomycetota bacterium]
MGSVHLELTTAVTLLVAALDLYAIATALTRRLGVESTLAWIFAILALPAVGALAYLLLAGPSIQRTTRRKRAAALQVRVGVAAGGASAAPAPARPEDALSSGETSLLRLAANLTELSPTGGNAVELLAENERAYETIAAALQAARRSIWAESYIIKKDETGQRFLDLLAEKARAGVEVRLLYDAMGSLGIDARRLAALQAAGGRAAAFLPVNPLRKRWAVQMRNHRKLIVVDGEVGFTGGMNIGNEYSGRLRRRIREVVVNRTDPDHFQDAHLSVRGPAVADLAQTFAEDWGFATDEELELPPVPPPVDGQGTLDLHDADGSAVVAVIPSGPDQAHNANGLVHFAGIAAARARIWLESAYFIPDEALMTALVSAALRGVDVRVVVPAVSDVGLVRAAARSYYPALLRGGVRVFEFQPSMLHSKTVVVDGRWGLVGSANMDIRSFRLNFELGALVLGRDFARRMEERFLADVAQSVEVTAEALRAQGWWARLRDGAARLLSPLL